MNFITKVQNLLEIEIWRSLGNTIYLLSMSHVYTETNAYCMDGTHVIFVHFIYVIFIRNNNNTYNVCMREGKKKLLRMVWYLE